jgi:hypothetical protein
MSKPGADPASGISLGDVLRLPERHPACRRREAQSGSCTERENLAGDAKGKGASGSTARPKVPMRRRGADCPVVVMKRVMPVEQRGQVIAVELGPTGSYQEKPEGSAEGGSLRAVTRAG